MSFFASTRDSLDYNESSGFGELDNGSFCFLKSIIKGAIWTGVIACQMACYDNGNRGMLESSLYISQ